MPNSANVLFGKYPPAYTHPEFQPIDLVGSTSQVRTFDLLFKFLLYKDRPYNFGDVFGGTNNILCGVHSDWFGSMFDYYHATHRHRCSLDPESCKTIFGLRIVTQLYRLLLWPRFSWFRSPNRCAHIGHDAGLPQALIWRNTCMHVRAPKIVRVERLVPLTNVCGRKQKQVPNPCFLGGYCRGNINDNETVSSWDLFARRFSLRFLKKEQKVTKLLRK